MNAVVLERANHLQAGAIADMREARISMAAEVSLQDAPVLRPIEHRAPRLEFADAIGRFLRVQLGHSPIVHVLAAAHRVGEVHPPAVAIIDVRERGRDAAFGHHGVRFAEQRLADEPDRHASRRRFNRRAQTRPARADDKNVVLQRFVFSHRARLEQPEVVPDAHRAKAHVKIGEADPEKAQPCPKHVPLVQTGHAAVGRESGRA